MGSEWHFIEDIDDSLRSRRSELASLADIWRERVSTLSSSESIAEFNKRLCREWAIETGVIENLYTIDRGITQLLIEKGIEASLIPYGATNKRADAVIEMVRDQETALEGLFDFVKQNRQLSTSYIRQLHQVFTEHQDFVTAQGADGNQYETRLIKGDWKKLPNSPLRPDGTLHEYTPPEHVAAELDRLLAMHFDHQDAGVSPEVEAAWLHHRFTQIHPFQDGNGRVARALASLVFLRASWFPLVVTRDDTTYIDALEVADSGNLVPLIELFEAIQKRSFLQALSQADAVLSDNEPVTAVISAAVEKLGRRLHQRESARKNVFNIAKQLELEADKGFRSVAENLMPGLRALNSDFNAVVDRSTETNDFWFKSQIVALAKQFHYFADTRTYRAWVRLKINEERHAALVISFHVLGAEFLGVMAASAFLEFRDATDESDTRLDEPICTDVFQFSHDEAVEAVKVRFKKWANELTVFGLSEWQRQL